MEARRAGLSCGGGGEAEEPETPRPDDPAAASLLLRLSDFATGWTEDTLDDDSANPFDECQADDAPGLRGRAETGDFSGDGGNSYIGQALALFETVDAAAHSWDAFRPLAPCMVDLINDGILDDNEAEAWTPPSKRCQVERRAERSQVSGPIGRISPLCACLGSGSESGVGVTPPGGDATHGKQSRDRPHGTRRRRRRPFEARIRRCSGRGRIRRDVHADQAA